MAKSFSVAPTVLPDAATDWLTLAAALDALDDALLQAAIAIMDTLETINAMPRFIGIPSRSLGFATRTSVEATVDAFLGDA
jgi:hypothetical protein